MFCTVAARSISGMWRRSSSTGSTLFEVFAAGYDPRYLERSMEIVDARLPEAQIVAVEPQSKSMRDALQAMFTLAAEGKLRHRGDPVLRRIWRTRVWIVGMGRRFGGCGSWIRSCRLMRCRRWRWRRGWRCRMSRWCRRFSTGTRCRRDRQARGDEYCSAYCYKRARGLIEPASRGRREEIRKIKQNGPEYVTVENPDAMTRTVAGGAFEQGKRT
jgi:hypothetical protein